MDLGICITLIILCLVIGVVGGFLLRVKMHEKSFAETKNDYLNSNTKLLSVSENEDEFIVTFNNAIFNDINDIK